VAARLTAWDGALCPDAETLAAFLDNRLAEREREIIAGHLASCESCYVTFTEAARIQVTAAGQVPGDSWWTRPRMMSAAAALAAAAVFAMAVGLGVMPWQRTEPQLDVLVAAVGHTRLVEPRLTGGFNYGPLITTRSGQPVPLTASPRVRIAAAQIDRDTATESNPVALQLQGAAALMIGNIDAAVVALERAVSLRPDDARVYSDLAAAYLVRHRWLGDASDLSAAHVAATRAVELDATLTEAHFNRALALEHLGEVAEARAAWQRYLEIDHDSGWAEEARGRLQSLPVQP
jgi:hypothetical protein